jgi:hypothetical protein
MNPICSELIIGMVTGNCDRLVPLMQHAANPERLKASQ